MTLSIRFTSAVPIVGNDSTTDLGIPPSLAERVRVSVPLFSTNKSSSSFSKKLSSVIGLLVSLSHSQRLSISLMFPYCFVLLDNGLNSEIFSKDLINSDLFEI